MNDASNSDPITQLPESINPYWRAAALLRSRMVWDFNITSWSSRAKLRKWKHRYIGRKAVILCNGPSLLRTDFSLLSGVFCLGLNKVYLLFKREAFRPQCIVAVNRFVIEQSAEFYNQTDIPLFLDSYAQQARLIKPRAHVVFLHSAPGGFARDCSISVDQGTTVTYVALQLAFHMGFQEVALVGADHEFAESGPAHKIVTAGEIDRSHFDPNYFAGGVKWQLPDLYNSEVAYVRARRTYEAFGRRVVNCTEGGKLEVFDRESLEKFVLS